MKKSKSTASEIGSAPEPILRQQPRKRRSFKEKQNWILERLEREWQQILRTTVSGHYPPDISPSDESAEEAWHQEFGGYRKWYLMGNHVSPDFARTLRRMWENGILYRSTFGNQGARDGGYAMKTYSVSYRLKRHHHEAKKVRLMIKLGPNCRKCDGVGFYCVELPLLGDPPDNRRNCEICGGMGFERIKENPFSLNVKSLRSTERDEICMLLSRLVDEHIRSHSGDFKDPVRKMIEIELQRIECRSNADRQ